jgi:hypothetical protein
MADLDGMELNGRDLLRVFVYGLILDLVGTHKLGLTSLWLLIGFGVLTLIKTKVGQNFLFIMVVFGTIWSGVLAILWGERLSLLQLAMLAMLIAGWRMVLIWRRQTVGVVVRRR